MVRIDDGSISRKAMTLTTTGSLEARSYLWKPWFATVDGGINLSRSRTTTEGMPGRIDDFITGNGGLSLLPRSRFPFRGYFDVRDSRSDATLYQSDSRTRRFGMKQDYQPLARRERYNAMFDRIVATSAQGRDTSTSLQGAMSALPSDTQSVNANGGFVRKSQDWTQSSSSQRTLAVNHRYNEPDELLLSVQTLANTGSIATSAAAASTTTNFLQLSSTGTWLPDTEKPMQVSGGARFSTTSNETQLVGSPTEVSKTQALGANAGARYQSSERTIWNGAAAVSRTQSGFGSSVGASQSLGVNHMLSSVVSLGGQASFNEQTSTGAPDAVTSAQSGNIAYSPRAGKLKGFEHRWGLTATLSNQYSNRSTPKQTASLRGRQNLQRIFPLSETQGVIVLLSQSVGLVTRGQSVNHQATGTWLHVGDRTSGSVKLALSDNRSFGERLAGGQLLDLSGTMNSQSSRTSSIIGNFSFQAARRLYAKSSLETSTTSDLTYQQSRFMRVPRLVLNSTLRAMWLRPAVVETAATANTTAASTEMDRKSLVWENQLTYQLGRLSASLALRIARIANVTTESLVFNVSRRF